MHLAPWPRRASLAEEILRSLPPSSLPAILSSALFSLANTRQGFPLVSAVSDAHTACVGDGGALTPGFRRYPGLVSFLSPVPPDLVPFLSPVCPASTPFARDVLVEEDRGDSPFLSALGHLREAQERLPLSPPFRRSSLYALGDPKLFESTRPTTPASMSA